MKFWFSPTQQLYTSYKRHLQVSVNGEFRPYTEITNTSNILFDDAVLVMEIPKGTKYIYTVNGVENHGIATY